MVAVPLHTEGKSRTRILRSKLIQENKSQCLWMCTKALVRPTKSGIATLARQRGFELGRKSGTRT